MKSYYDTRIFTTTEYDLFKRLKGNRDVTNKRVAIIKESISSIGYVSNPVIVNENYEVIDGQGRVRALMELGLPVEYRIITGLGIDDCRAMNLKPTGWSINDFVKSYAEYGNKRGGNQHPPDIGHKNAPTLGHHFAGQCCSRPKDSHRE